MAAQRSYLPPRVQQQMAQTLQRTLPSNLKQYATGNTYIPEHAKQAIMQHMEMTMPAHLREYSTEFMREQSISGAQTVHAGQTQATQHFTPAPSPNRMRRDHSLGFGQQYTVNLDNPTGLEDQGNIAYTQQYQSNANSKETSGPSMDQTSTPHEPNYDFIVNYNHHQRNDWLTNAPFKTRIITVAGGFLALLILAWAFIAFLSSSGGGSVQSFTVLAQEQTELARISDEPSRTADSDATQNLASTTRATLLSDESTFASYLGGLGSRPGTDVLAKNRNPQTDAELDSARTNGTYDQTYTSIATTQLTKYATDLKLAFNAARNPTERQLLSQAYSNVQLLLDLTKANS